MKPLKTKMEPWKAVGLQSWINVNMTDPQRPPQLEAKPSSYGYNMYVHIYIYIPRESHVYSLPWILCKSYSLPRPHRPRADHADHALTPFRPSLCCQHRLTVLALTPKQDLNRFPTCKIRLDSYNLIHVAIMTSSVISCNTSNPKRHAVRCGCDQHRNK